MEELVWEFKLYNHAGVFMTRRMFSSEQRALKLMLVRFQEGEFEVALQTVTERFTKGTVRSKELGKAVANWTLEGLLLNSEGAFNE